MTRRALIIAGAALGAVLIALLAIWLARAPLAEWAIRRALDQRGVAADFEISRLDTNGATLRDIRLGARDVVIPRADLDYELGELFARRIRAIRLTRPQAELVLDEDSASIAGFEIGGGEGGAPPVDIGLVSVESGLITVVSPAGELEVELDIEGGPGRGWRGWARAEPGAAAWRGWSAEVESGDAEFEMIGDDLLARASLSLGPSSGADWSAESADVAATARLTGVDSGFDGAEGEAAVNATLRAAEAENPEAVAARLIGAQLADAPVVGPLAAPLRARLAATLVGFDAELGAMIAVTPEAVTARLENPVTIEAAAGPDVTLSALPDEPVAAWRRDGSGWRAEGALTIEGGPALDLSRFEVAMEDGRAAFSLAGDLAPFGDGETQLGFSDLAADWAQTADGWRASADGAVRITGALPGASLTGAELDGGARIDSTGGGISLAPLEDGRAVTLRAAGMEAGGTRFENVGLRLVPALQVRGSNWRLDPGPAPMEVTAGAIILESMRLADVALRAPRGGLAMDGEGGSFLLTDSEGPVAVSLGLARGGGWTARGVSSARVNSAEGPLLQRTDDGQTFLNALAAAMAVEAFELESGTAFRGLEARDVHMTGPVTPEMELEVSASVLTSSLDTLGRTGLALETGAGDATLSSAPGAPLSARFTIGGARLSGGELPVALSEGRLSGMAVFADPLSADIRIERAVVGMIADPAPVTPATLSGDLVSEDGIVTMEMSGQARGAPAGSLQVSLRHNLQTGIGGASVDLPRLEFAPRGAQPQDVISALRGLVAEVSGPVEAHFTAQWYGNAMRSSGEIVLDNVDMATRFGPVEDVSTRFEMSSLAPLLTPEPQTVTIGSVNPGIPLEDGEITFELLPEGLIRISDARWPFAGGNIALAPFTWVSGQTRHEPTVVAENLNLGFLAGMFDNANLDAGGTVSGRVPLIIDGGDITVDHAVLTGDDEGFLSYAGQAAEAAAQSNEQANLAFRALENLQYRVLELSLNGPLAGEMELDLRVEGFNPDVLDGYPFLFNINLSAELMRLIRETTQGFRIQQQIENSLRESQENGAESGQ